MIQFRRLVFEAILAAITTISCASLMRGQATGTVLGSVLDPSGAPVAGANVQLVNESTNVNKTTSTNDAGYYEIIDVIPGQYTLTVEMQGFKKSVKPNFEVQVGQFARIDMKLELGTLSETVNVGEQAPLLNTAEATVGQVVGVRETQELPLNGRNYLQLVTLAPGTSTYAGRSFYNSALTDNAGSVISGGAGDERNEITLDGVNIKSYMINYAFVPSIDAIREFQVQTTPYSAELGKSAGAQIRLDSRSGGNSFHGTAYEFLRNSALDAKNFFDNPKAPIPPFRQNQFGASLGGPILKDKVFFFLNYEGFRNSLGETFFGTVPTTLMLNGNFSEGPSVFDPATTRPDPSNPGRFLRDQFPNNVIPTNRINLVSAYYAAHLYPQPTNSGFLSNFATSAQDTTQRDQFNTRIDYAGAKDALFGRFSFNNSTLFLAKGLFGTGQIPGFGDNFINNSRNIVVSETHTLNPTTVLSARASYFRNFPSSSPQQLGNNVNEKFGIQGVYPNEPFSPNVSGVLNPVTNAYAPEFFISNQYQYALSLAKAISAHSMKIGGEYNRLQLFETAPRSPAGDFYFGGQFTGDPTSTIGSTGQGFADFLLGLPNYAQSAQPIPAGQLFRNVWNAYIDDNWRVTPNLTLDLGLRYEFIGNPYDKYNRLSNFNSQTGQLVLAGQNGVSRSTLHTDWNNFAPRFGFAWALPNRRLSIRGGYGIFYDIVQMNSFNAVRANPPFVQFRTFTVNNPIDQIPTTPIQTVFGSGAQTALPAVQAIDPNLRTGYIQNGSFTVQRQFAGEFLAEVGYARQKWTKFTAGRDLDAPFQNGTFLRPYPQYGGISQLANIEDGNYNALLAKLEKRFSKGLSFLASYTFAKTIDNTSVGSAILTASGTGDGFQNPYCFSCNRGRADSDNRHRFVLSGLYEVPRLVTSNSLANYLLGGWETSGILTLQSGFPITPFVTGGVSQSLGGGDRPDRAEGVPIFPDGTRTVNRWFNPSAFFVQPLGQFGQVGRNVFDGPGLVTLDFSVMKNFYVAERLKIQFRTEFFNIANHPNFNFPNSTINTPTAGIISSTVTPSRQIQFALKLAF